MKDQRKEAEFLARVQKHQSILHKICFVYCRNATDKEDLYQEMILQLWKSYGSFRGQSAFSTWMYRVALNTALTVTRKRTLFAGTPLAPDIADEGFMADNLSDEIHLLHKAITQLKKVEKAVILLWLEEKSYEEIAGIIGISEKNVSVRLVRIRARLAEILNKVK